MGYLIPERDGIPGLDMANKIFVVVALIRKNVENYEHVFMCCTCLQIVIHYCNS